MSDPGERRALLKAIRRLARAIDIQSRQFDRELGLTLPQYIVLTAVHDLQNGTNREIAAAADASPATVVGILDKLEAKGLIMRARSTSDRRSVHIRLTEKGAETLALTPFPLGPGFETAFAALSADARSRTIATLNELAELAAPNVVAFDEEGEAAGLVRQPRTGGTAGGLVRN